MARLIEGSTGCGDVIDKKNARSRKSYSGRSNPCRLKAAAHVSAPLIAVQAALRGGLSRAPQERTKRQIEGLGQRSSDERCLVEAALEAATPVQGYSRHEIVSLELGMALGKDLVSDLGSQILELSELEGRRPHARQSQQSVAVKAPQSRHR